MVHFEHHNKSETEVVSLAGEGGVKVMDEYYPMKSLNFFLHEIVHHFFGFFWRISFLFSAINSGQISLMSWIQQLC